MVKASSSRRPSSFSPPLASLSLASTPLKPNKPSPSFSSFLKRRPSFSTQPMEPPSLPSNSTTENPHNSSTTDYNLSTDRQGTRESSETPSSLGEDAASVIEKQSSMCSRQRLQQYRMQMSGKVVIPDTWGREHQLQEWVSYGIIEDALRPAGLMSAQIALVSECQHRGNKPGRTPPPLSVDVEVS